MLLAVKGNREVKIETDDKERYLENGYSLFEKGEGGKVISLAKPEKKSKELIALEKENADLKLRLAELEEGEVLEEPKKAPTTGKGK